MTTEPFSDLERALLAWIAQRSTSAALTQQLESATLQRRDYMRTGFFVYLSSDPACDKVEAGVRAVCPLIQSDALYDGAGSNLFLRDGRLHYLEIYARGGFLPEQLDSFTLIEDD